MAIGELSVRTNFFSKYKNNQIEFIDASNFAIGIITRFLVDDDFSEKIQKLVNQVYELQLLQE